MTTRWHNTGGPIADTVTTNDATPTNVITFDLSNGNDHRGGNQGIPALDNTLVHAQLLLLGRSGSNRVRLYAERSFAITSGVLSAVDAAPITPLTNFLSAALSTAALTLDANGTTIRARATGVAATTIVWTGWLWLFSGEF